MPGIHPVLERQLTRHGILDLSAPPTVEQWYRFLERVSQTYADADRERVTLERQLRQTSDSLKHAHSVYRAGIDTVAARVQSGGAPNELLTLLSAYRDDCERDEQEMFS